MLPFDRWILSLLLLGHLIAGVNREVLSTVSGNPTVGGLLSKEARRILHSYYKISSSEDDYIEGSSPTLSRHTRSVSKSNRLVCPPYDSCINRCGNMPKPLPYTCNCDTLCTIFSDCCVDYTQQCRQHNLTLDIDKSLSITRSRCELLFMKYNLLSVNRCPDEYKNAAVKTMCSLEIPKDCIFPDSLNESDAEQVFIKCRDLAHRSCMSKLKFSCDSKVEPLCSVMTKECRKHASRKCDKCNTRFWPVLAQNGIIYRNSYCAVCNSQESFDILSPYNLESMVKEKDEFNATDERSMHLTRHCIPVDIDSCPQDSEMKDLCYNHSGAVIAGLGKNSKIYKNTHCALCNGKGIEELRCATFESVMRGLIRPLLETFITGSGQGIKFDDIPAAFSILLNFGLDGRERMYFNSEDEEEMKRNQEKCGQGKIWDPFSQVCRRLYCSTEFVLVDYRCVRKETSDKDELASRNESTSVVPDSRAEFVHLTLTAEMEMLDVLQFYGQDIEAVWENIRESLATSFGINIERVKNVRFNISIGFSGDQYEITKFIEEMDDVHPIIFKIEFDLYEESAVNVTEPEPSVEKIVSMLASSLSMNGFELDINNVTSRIFEIHQTISPLESWCNSESGGIKKEYWNSEFSLILSDDNSTSRENRIEGIYVNKTGKLYPQGKFVVDILFQGYQFSSSLINVSGVAIVCDKVNLNESCIRMLIDSHEYSILENGTLYIHNESLRNAIDDSSYELAENNSLWICLKSWKAISNNKIYNIEMDLTQAIVSYVLLWISVIAMAIVLITYITFASLRNLPGCNTMNLTFSLMAMQLTFIFGQRSTVVGTACTVVGHLLHYEILCCFMWMNVMAFDLFRTFGNKNVLSNIRSKRKYLPRYMIYAYLSPASVIVIPSLLDYFSSESNFAPHYGKGSTCWINNEFSALIFFALPLAAVMCSNFIFFLLTICAMRSVKKLSHISDLKTNQTGKNDVSLYFRMALVIGLTWALSFAAASTKKTKLLGDIFTYLFIICNTLQGVFLFTIFVCNKKVYELYKGAFRKLFREVLKHAKRESAPAKISRFSDIVKRSSSTNTVTSTLSNASTSSVESQISTITE